MATPSRQYESAVRVEQARATRRRVLEAAAILFCERGYGGTTVEAVAASAGVSVATLYNSVGGKPVLLKAVYDRLLAGDDEPVPVAHRPAFRALQEAADGRSCLSAYARLGREMAERVGPLLGVIVGQSGSGDDDLRAFAATLEGERATGTRMVADLVAERFGLRSGLSVEEAADVLWTLTAPELFHRLVTVRGWPWDRYETWLGEAMADALLGAGAAPRRLLRPDPYTPFDGSRPDGRR